MHRRGGLIPPPLDQSRQRVDGPVINVQVKVENLSSAVTIWRSSFLAARYFCGISPRLVVAYRAMLVRGRRLGKEPNFRSGKGWKLWAPFRGTHVRSNARNTRVDRRPNIAGNQLTLPPTINSLFHSGRAGSCRPGAGGQGLLLRVLLHAENSFQFIYTYNSRARGS
jgi:hypothetical protein